MSTTMTEAIRKTVLVDFTPEEAFDLFTARIASWWPVRTHSYGGDDVKDVVLEPGVGGRLYEVTADGEQDWGKVLAWEPPTRLLLDWQIGEARGTESRSPSSRRPGQPSRARAPRLQRRRPPRALLRRVGRRARDLRRERVEEGLKPAQPLLPRHGRVGGRGRGQHEERRLAEAALLQPELGPLAERAAVGLLADEPDRARLELARDPLEPLGRAGEVAPAEVARAGRRAVGGVRDADPVVEQLELLGGSSSRGVKPAACSSRQKSLRGFAKCAFAAAETRPGLIPQKSAVRPGAEDVGDVRA